MAHINIHYVKNMKAEQSGSTAWLRITGREDNVSLHIDRELADRLEAAFTEYHDWLSGQEGPTYDDALAAKCDAKAREDEARALK